MTSDTTNNLLKLQEYIDTVKSDIPDGIYLELCNRMRDIFNISSTKEKNVRKNVCNLRRIVEVERGLEDESIDSELLEFLNYTYRMEGILNSFRFHLESKFNSRKKYTENLYEDMEERMDTIKDLVN